MKGGMIVEWETPEGKKKGFAYRADQEPEFSNRKKVLVKNVNDDLSPKLKDGKQVVSLKDETRLKVVGYLD